ncbi:MAG: ComF family protein [Balneolaceae bacterium]|nr:ComF family protein [Balneolaceae bacterium]
MWYFDKGGYLQKLLHDLKYHHLKGVGVELGECLGRAFLNNLDSSIREEFALVKPLLVPVPLYKSRQRKRGYNQARAMAEGVARVTSWPVSREGLIIRKKNTKTQTGLNSHERENNLSGAFEVTDSAELQDKFLILIDDVFTTGSTTFEVAKTVLNDEEKAGILTVAKA